MLSNTLSIELSNPATVTEAGLLSSIDKVLLNNTVAKNTTIIGATKTKITYDSKGLVTAGVDATATDIVTTPIVASGTTIALASTTQSGVNSELAIAIKTNQNNIPAAATALETETGTDNVKYLSPADTEAVYIKKSVINAKGDIIVGTANDVSTILPSGTNGQVLTVDTTTATGLRYTTVSGASGGQDVIIPTPYTNLAAQTTATGANQITQNTNTGDVVIKDNNSDTIQIINSSTIAEGATLIANTTLTAIANRQIIKITGNSTTVPVVVTLPVASTQKTPILFYQDISTTTLASYQTAITAQGTDKISNIPAGTNLMLANGSSISKVYQLISVTGGYQILGF